MALISVLIPTYRRPGLLQKAVASAAAQQGVEAEVIVEPDERATGQSATLNRALARARGELVTVLHDDDYYWTPEALAALEATLAAHPTAAAAYSLPQYVNVFGVPVRTPPTLAAFAAAHPVVTWATLAEGFAVHGGGFLYRRAALEAAGPWDEGLPACQEWEYHLRMLHRGARFVACPTVTVAYRLHMGQLSRRGGRIGRRSAVRATLRREIAARYRLTLQGAA